MGIESARLFFERVKTDKEFAKAYNECRDPYARRAFEEREGYEFSTKEARQVNGGMMDVFGFRFGDKKDGESARRERKYMGLKIDRKFA
jgi:predicted ribosomally synthesized peptide with nif11-like leader